MRVNANGHVYGQVDLDEDSDKSNSNYHRPYGVSGRPSVLLSPDYTGECDIITVRGNRGDRGKRGESSCTIYVYGIRPGNVMLLP